MADFTPLFEKYGAEYDLDPRLGMALSNHESGGDPSRIGRDGEVGLMQILPSTGREVANRLGIKNPDLRDPETNIRIGMSYLNDRLKEGEAAAAKNPAINATDYGLMGYNGGPDSARWSPAVYTYP